MLTGFISAFLIAHGVVHAILAAAPIPNDPSPKPGSFFTASTRSWLLSRLGSDAVVKWTGIVLVALTTVGFILAGVGSLGVAGLSSIWRTLAVVSAIGSMLLLILFWHSWLVAGVLIDIGILILLLLAKWPPQPFVG
jgi:hypothetical protein